METRIQEKPNNTFLELCNSTSAHGRARTLTDLEIKMGPMRLNITMQSYKYMRGSSQKQNMNEHTLNSIGYIIAHTLLHGYVWMLTNRETDRNGR